MCDLWKQPKRHMPLSTVIHHLDSVLESWPNTEVRLTGGEPCLHPHYSNIVKEVKHRNLSVSVITNSTLFSNTTSLHERVGRVFLSIDSPYNKEQIKIRGRELGLIPVSYKNNIVANVIVSTLNSKCILHIPDWLKKNSIEIINLIPMKTPDYMHNESDLDNLVFQVLSRCAALNIKHFVEGKLQKGIDAKKVIQILKVSPLSPKCYINKLVNFIDINDQKFNCNSIPHRGIETRQEECCCCNKCSPYSAGHCDFSNIIYNSLMQQEIEL